MDRRAAVGRNPHVHPNAPQPTLDTTATIPALDPADVVMVDVVVLSGDLALYDAIRYSVGERNPVWRWSDFTANTTAPVRSRRTSCELNSICCIGSASIVVMTDPQREVGVDRDPTSMG